MVLMHSVSRSCDGGGHQFLLGGRATVEVGDMITCPVMLLRKDSAGTYAASEWLVCAPRREAMSSAAGCPECGAEVKFTKPGAVLSICAHCSSVVAKRGLDYAKLGRSRSWPRPRRPWQLGCAARHGGFGSSAACGFDHGRDLERVVSGHRRRKILWLAEAQGASSFKPRRSGAAGTALHKIHPATASTCRCPMHRVTPRCAPLKSIAPESWSQPGQIPFEFQLGQPMRYVDLSGAKGSVGTLDYGAAGERDPGATGARCAWMS